MDGRFGPGRGRLCDRGGGAAGAAGARPRPRPGSSRRVDRAAGRGASGARNRPGSGRGCLLRGAIVARCRGGRAVRSRRTLRGAAGSGEGDRRVPSRAGGRSARCVARGESGHAAGRAARAGGGLGSRCRHRAVSGPRGPLRRPGAGRKGSRPAPGRGFRGRLDRGRGRGAGGSRVPGRRNRQGRGTHAPVRVGQRCRRHSRPALPGRSRGLRE